MALDSAALADAQPVVHADRVRLKQVIANLLSNAVKYNRLGGRLQLAVRARAAQWLLDIRDDGNGLDAAQRARLFSAFDRLGAQAGRSPAPASASCASSRRRWAAISRSRAVPVRAVVSPSR